MKESKRVKWGLTMGAREKHEKKRKSRKEEKDQWGMTEWGPRREGETLRQRLRRVSSGRCGLCFGGLLDENLTAANVRLKENGIIVVHDDCEADSLLFIVRRKEGFRSL